jgi:hypothetical protein
MDALEDPRVVAALIAVLGVLASAFVSIRVSRAQSEIVRRNLLLEFHHKFNDRLYEKRIEVYPALYLALSKLGKRFRANDLSRGDFGAALREIEEWDSNNAIYVSPSIVALLLNIRNKLAHALRFAENPVGVSERDSIFDAALRLEQALREEIGVYSVVSFHNAALYEGPLHSWRSPQRKDDTDH